MSVPVSKLSLLGEKTMLPVGLVIVLGYLCIWGVKLSDKVDAQASDIVEVKTDQKAYNKTVYKIKNSLYRIEDKMKIAHPSDAE